MMQALTFGELRASCVRDVLIYCRDNRFETPILLPPSRFILAAPGAATEQPMPSVDARLAPQTAAAMVGLSEVVRSEQLFGAAQQVSDAKPALRWRSLAS
jgi:hypothetical protein